MQNRNINYIAYPKKKKKKITKLDIKHDNGYELYSFICFKYTKTQLAQKPKITPNYPSSSSFFN